MKKSIKLAFLLGTLIFTTSCKNTKDSEETQAVSAEMTEPEAKNSEKNSEYADGKAVYTQYCISCHQANGSGVPNLNPPLTETDYVLGDKQELIRIILNGSSAGLEVKGNTYANNMPAFDYLKDKEIANVLSYIRNDFGNSAEAVSVEDVQMARDTK